MDIINQTRKLALIVLRERILAEGAFRNSKIHGDMALFPDKPISMAGKNNLDLDVQKGLS